MRIGCCEACSCLSFCFESAKQALAATILTLDEIRSNPEAFQKTCILAESVIQGYNFYFHTNHLPQLIEILDVAYSFDVYGFCRLPRYLLHPYMPERLDGDVISDDLEAILCDNWHRGLPDEEGKCRDPEIRQFAEDRLTDLLEEMLEFEYDLRTEEEFKDLLQRWFVSYLENNPEDKLDPYSIDFQDLKVPLKKSHFLVVLDDILFIGVDIACIPSFLQKWKLIDLSFISLYLAGTPLLAWTTRKSFDDWITVFMCMGFLMQFLEAFRSLYSDDLTQEERKNSKWIMAAALAEILYNSAILERKDPRLITFLAFAAKSFGLIQILLASRKPFFTVREHDVETPV